MINIDINIIYKKSKKYSFFIEWLKKIHVSDNIPL